MKKNVIINVPMTIMPQKTRYDSDDRSLPVSDRATGFPVMSFLERTLAKEDEVKMILLAKRSPYSKWEQRVNEIREEIAEIMNTDRPSSVEAAVVPIVPASPNTTRNVVLGAVILAILAIAIIVIRHLADDTIKSDDDVKKYLGLDTLAQFPLIKGKASKK